MQKKKEPNLEMRKSFDFAKVAPTLSFPSVGKCGYRRGRLGGFSFRAALGSPPGTLVSDFSVRLTSFLSFPHTVFRLVDSDLGFQS